MPFVRCITYYICFCAVPAIAQQSFISPLDISLKLSGNFGEIRNNHFHSGIDIKTDSATGKNVYAVADGHIARIKVSAVGYGNALYLKHDNGYTSVYGHLLQFADSVRQYVTAEQNLKNSFEVEVFPDSNLFRVKQGAIIARSGNSGSSGGPHLHFEIRDSLEQIVNPQLFGINVADTIQPVIEALAVYDEMKFTALNQNISYDTAHQAYILNDTLSVTTHAAFGIMAYDLCNNSSNKLGIYKMQLHIDTTLIWQSNFDYFSFDKTRYVNAHIDYAEKVLNKNIIERCFKLPGDSFNVYHVYPYKLKAQKIYHAAITLADINGNRNKLIFCFKTNAKTAKPQKPHHSWVWLKYNQPYNLKTNTFLLILPSGSLYQNCYLKYHTSKAGNNYLSAIHHINDNTIPLHKAATISIKTKLDSALQSKALIIQIDSAKTSYIGGLYKNNAVSALIRTFGSFAVVVDTVPPNVTITNPKNIYSATDTLVFFMEDDLTGIGKYQLSLLNQKLIGSYDAKTHTLSMPAALIPEGESQLKLEVTDLKDNTYIFEFGLVVRLQKPMHNE
ncbi:MAG: M23 family metallopeptidase [Bacteroidia bacterium]|nr:M23 family metallopeptidase [Bacteroidia bacterium]